MLEMVNKFLGIRKTTSKDDAKQRMKVLLIHDRVNLTPAQLELMKGEILEVVARYCEIDPEGVEINLNRHENGISLDSTVPVRRVTARV